MNRRIDADTTAAPGASTDAATPRAPTPTASQLPPGAQGLITSNFVPGQDRR